MADASMRPSPLPSTDDGHGDSLAESARQALAWYESGSCDNPPPQRTLDRLLAASPDTLPRLDHRDRRIVAAAMILVRSRQGLAGVAAQLADAESAHSLIEPDATLPPADLVRFWSIASQAHGTAGLVCPAVQAADRALGHARESGRKDLLFRAYSGVAATRALGGEYALAAGAIARAHALLPHQNGFSSGEHLLLVAQTFVAAARLDSADLAQSADRLRRIPPHEPTRLSFAAYADATRFLIDRQYSAGIAAITHSTHGADREVMPPLIHGLLLSLHATILTARGEPSRALTLLDPMTASPDHIVCFNLRRAAAHLQLGNDQLALDATDDCIRLGSAHNLRDLPSVLVGRAVARERLGRRQTADSDFADAVHLIHGSGAMDVLLTMPREPLETLLRRLLRRQPAMAMTADRLIRWMPAMATTTQPPTATLQLTAREAVVARQLRSSASLRQLAAALYVSPNTVKSQLRSLYRKLGVTRRAEAVAALEGAGFYDVP